jgi:hypothetical protein
MDRSKRKMEPDKFLQAPAASANRSRSFSTGLDLTDWTAAEQGMKLKVTKS